MWQQCIKLPIGSRHSNSKHRTAFAEDAVPRSFLRDNKNLFMASHNGEVKKIELTHGKQVKQYLDKVEDITSLDVSHDNRKLLMSTKEKVFIWDVETGKELEKIEPKLTEEINETVFTLDGKKDHYHKQ